MGAVEGPMPLLLLLMMIRVLREDGAQSQAERELEAARAELRSLRSGLGTAQVGSGARAGAARERGR